MNSRKNRGASTPAIIAVIAIVAVVVTVLVILPFFQASYDSGRFSGTTTYTNDWAKVKVEIPSDWKMNSQTISKKNQMMRIYTAPKTCPFIGICTIKSKQSVDAGLEEIRESVTGGYTGVSGVSITTKSKSTRKIAGQTYKCLPVVMSGNGITIYINFYARKVNREGSIVFVAAGYSEDEVEQVLGYISKYSK